ncbi:DUF7882 family protein [Herbiconiux sp. SYSU D00978]|uniref:DUF7882 family protein n=1 Tax=Herbiconiux sp. SYSU D00978 TaxID=2812562 RepID=UPI001A96DD51|nr:ATP-dependent DNA ligase [Herbiconiux sp. SYSU D00978]
MGTLSYDGATVEFDDRLLAHLQIVIVNKFRRNESFAISWLNSLADGDGRSSIWLTPTTPAFFRFAGSRAIAIDQKWVQVLSESANSSTGLIVVDAEQKLMRGASIVRWP